MSPTSSISQVKNMVTSGMGQTVIQGGKALIEATGITPKLKRWAVDSLESNCVRRHNVKGTNRQVWGALATKIFIGGGAIAAVSVGAVCLPLGIAIGVTAGICALGTTGLTIAGIRRSYNAAQKNNLYNGGNIDGCQFLKETVQNITVGAIQVCFSKEKIDVVIEET